ncbi:MAG: T9SS type A sorting domain-containing protein, partial [Candidatus Kapabacteria bacterium]|nr:T9SS type A sorting domain-containing protein [Candidatus Kapabacteria bacterium]
TIILLKPPGTQAENPEWMYFHDIKSIYTMAAIDNSILISIGDDVIDRVIRLNLEDLSIDTIGSYIISSFAKDANGDLWMSSLSEGVLHYKDGVITEYNTQNSGLPHNQVANITFDKEDNLWCATKNGLAKFDGTDWEVFRTGGSGEYDNEFHEVKFDTDGSSWQRVLGLRITHFKKGVFTSYDSTNTGIPALSLPNQIEIDSKGNKWIISGNAYIEQFGGLSKYDNTQWVFYDTENTDLQNDHFNSIAIDSNDVVWLGGYYNGLTKFDGTTWSNFIPSNSGISGEGAYQLCIDKFNNKWMVVYSELTQETVGLEVFREGGVLLPTNVEELFSKNDEIIPRLYPNPASEIITVTDLIKRERKFKISNLYGQTVLEGTFYHEIDISKLIPGFYFLKVDDFNLKFIKK